MYVLGLSLSVIIPRSHPPLQHFEKEPADVRVGELKVALVYHMRALALCFGTAILDKKSAIYKTDKSAIYTCYKKNIASDLNTTNVQKSSQKVKDLMRT